MQTGWASRPAVNLESAAGYGIAVPAPPRGWGPAAAHPEAQQVSLLLVLRVHDGEGGDLPLQRVTLGHQRRQPRLPLRDGLVEARVGVQHRLRERGKGMAGSAP